MKLIAWDTSSKAGAIVALEWDAKAAPEWKQVRLVAEFALNVDCTHSERLLWGIHTLLESARWKVEDVDVFGVGVGPGSFTGLRIGITTARTLAHTFQKPLVAVSSLAALARPVAMHFSQPGFASKTLVIAVTDACKGELFTLWGDALAISQCAVMPEGNLAGLWHSDLEERVVKPETLMSAIRETFLRTDPPLAWVTVGEGRLRYQEEWNKLSGLNEIENPFLYPHQIQGRYLGLLAWEGFQAGLSREGLYVYPRYLRASDAEVKLKAGLLPYSDAYKQII